MKKYIQELLILVNKYYPINLDYIKKYKINSFNEFNKLIEINNDYLLFNSKDSEQLFINIINVDMNYIKKYNKSFHEILSDFFINKNNKYYFNKCHKIFLNNHIENCSCKIKVKSVSSLKIDVFIEIFKEAIVHETKINNNNIILNYF